MASFNRQTLNHLYASCDSTDDDGLWEHTVTLLEKVFTESWTGRLTLSCIDVSGSKIENTSINLYSLIYLLKSQHEIHFHAGCAPALGETTDINKDGRRVSASYCCLKLNLFSVSAASLCFWSQKLYPQYKVLPTHPSYPMWHSFV